MGSLSVGADERMRGLAVDDGGMRPAPAESGTSEATMELFGVTGSLIQRKHPMGGSGKSTTKKMG